MEHAINEIELLGTAAGAPLLSHENHGRRFYRMPLDVARLSGTVDRLPLLLEDRLLEPACMGGQLRVRGQVRSYNQRLPDRRHLVISVLADALWPEAGEPENCVRLTGALCREPVYRRTPLGREICDAMLAVNRTYHRADYLPCIFWGRTAQRMAERPVGTLLAVEGRLQSRDYVKQLDTGPETRTAYEISVVSAELVR